MKTADLTVTRAIDGSPEDVYDAWLDSESPGSFWYGSKRVIFDLAVDGLFYILVDQDNREWAHYGRFISLERGRRIEHTFMSEPTRGLESVVTVTFTPRDGGTDVTLHHANVPDDEVGRGHEAGWRGCLDALAARIDALNARTP